MEEKIARSRWSSGDRKCQLDVDQPLSADKCTVKFSDRAIRDKDSRTTTVEEFSVSRNKVEEMVLALSKADRSGRGKCAEEYKNQWQSLRRSTAPAASLKISTCRGGRI